ncbi:MAG: hypothetical protein JW969_19730 [Spirochaetales bacterium]|nr:hypothetical protein [Spirochaetales bacterium]
MKNFSKWKVILTCICLIFLIAVSADARRRTTSTSTPTPASGGGTIATPTTPPSGGGGSSSGTTWAPYVNYTRGDVVTYNGVSYTCLTSHLSLPGWEPPNVPALWSPGSSGGGGTIATPTPTPQSSGGGGGSSSGGVTRPAECPADLWNYMTSAQSRLGMPADFALLIAAVCAHESAYGAWLTPGTSPSVGDGYMQVQPATRTAYAGMFSSTFGHAYDHNSISDQIAMGAMILKDMIVNYCGGEYRCGCLKYNGGPNYVPGTVDAYGRPVYAEQYADAVMATYRSYGGTHA